MKEARFNIESRKNKDGVIITNNVPVRLSFFFSGKRLEYYTQVRVNNAKNFNKDYYKTGKPVLKANEPEAARKNKLLKDIKNKAESLYDNAIALGIDITPAYLKNKLDEHFKGKSNATDSVLLKDAIREYIQYCQRTNAPGTTKKRIGVLNLLKSAFEKNFHKIQMNDVDTQFVEKFKQYLIKTGYLVDGNKVDYAYNTFVKYIIIFRGFINWCKDEDRMYHTIPIKFGKLQEEETNIIYLNAEEILRLETTEMPNKTLNQVKDVFLFGCYTGMRYSDIFKLQKKDVQRDSISFYITKDHKLTLHDVPLVAQSKSILNKYKNANGEKALPVISNQKMNDYVKEVMQLCGISDVITIREKKADGTIIEKDYSRWEVVSCHTSRKSFISLAVEAGTPELDIKAISGHSKHSRAFGRYYQVSATRKAKVMNKIFKNPSSKLRKVG